MRSVTTAGGVVCLVVFVLFLRPVVVNAQTATGALTGTVVDVAGGAVAGATVTFVHLGTNLRRDTVTSAEGRFSFVQMPPATYRVTAEHDGFEPARLAAVTVNVGDARQVRLELRPAGVAETLVVQGEAATIEASTGVGTVIDRQFVANLPLSGRSFQSLFDLTPGVLRSGGVENGQFVVNGQRADTNAFTVDGVSANTYLGPYASGNQAAGQLPSLTTLNTTSSLVSVDALQEFRILTSTYAPEYGRMPGGQISLVTRSGTNQLMGSAFEYFRDAKFDANDWFANRAGAAKPPMRQHDFGGVLGGPIARNRTFFFASYERLQLRRPQFANTFVPSVASRTAATPAMRSILDAYPLPTGPETLDSEGQPTGLAPYVASYADPSTTDATGVRIDQAIGRNQTIFGRVSHAPSSDAARLSGMAEISTTRRSTTTATLGDTWVVSSRVSNDLRVNLTRSTASNAFELRAIDGAVPVPDASMFPGFATAATAQAYVFLDFGAVLPAMAAGVAADNTSHQVHIVENLTLSAGAHAWKFGADYRRLQVELRPSASVSANFPTMQELLAGVVPRYEVTGRLGTFRPVVQSLSLYAQDTWRPLDRLSLTYGVRWELNPPPSEPSGHEPIALQGVDAVSTLDVAPAGTPIFRTAYTNLAPRIGVAYELGRRTGWETVLRGGWGLYYDLGTSYALQAYEGYPYRISTVYRDVAFPPGAAPDVVAPVFRTTPPYSTVVGYAPDFTSPRTYQWNVAVEQSLGRDQTMSVAYVGAAGRRLVQIEGYSTAPNPRFSDTVHVTRNAGWSDYASLQVQYTRRLSRGLQAMAAYTLAHSTDTASSSAGLAGVPATFVDLGYLEGDSDFDVRHNVASAVTYDIPAPWRWRLLRAVLGGVSIDTLVKARSGLPVNVLGARLPAPFNGTFRPNLVPGVPLYLDDSNVPGRRRVNPAAFQSVPGQMGNAPRNAVRGFGVMQVDLAVRKDIRLAGRVRLQLRAEAFNVLNRPNFANPSGTLSSPTFGRSTQMLNRSLRGINALYEIGGPRSAQFAAKLLF